MSDSGSSLSDHCGIDKSCQTSTNVKHCDENSKKLKFGIDAILSSECSVACRSNEKSKYFLICPPPSLSPFLYCWIQENLNLSCQLELDTLNKSKF